MLLQSILNCTSTWLRVSEAENQSCQCNDNALDALVASLVARASGSKDNYIEPGSPWENGYCESFNGKFQRCA